VETNRTDLHRPARNGRDTGERRPPADGGAPQPLEVYYSPAYHDTDVVFDTTVKSRHVAELIAGREDCRIVAPDPVDASDLVLVHDDAYVRAVRDGTPIDLASSNGIGWDDRLYLAVATSTGGIVQAALRALATGSITASLSSGLHHAGPESGRGFCTFNGIALAALLALRAGALRVLIIDLDAHCGGGTARIIDGVEGIEQIDVSTQRFDQYASRPDARLRISGADGYLGTVERMLDEVPDPAGVDLVIYNAGMDVHEEAGGDAGFTTDLVVDREHLVLGWAVAQGLPVAFTLAGGYTGHGRDLAGVAELHLETFRAAAAVAG